MTIAELRSSNTVLDNSKTCTRCALTTNVPTVTLDSKGVCNVCREYESTREHYDNYFKEEKDFKALVDATDRSQSEYDILLLYSGGKDSTYVLYRLVELGYRVLALTFDNGYIPSGCFDNIRGVCNDAGVKSQIISLTQQDDMDAVFAESLKKKSTVCYGCYRALTARGAEVAIENKIPIMATGLSRGQIAGREIHPLVAKGITDVGEIEAHIKKSREMLHVSNDEIGKLVNDNALAEMPAYRQLQFIDYYRYDPVTKDGIFELIRERAPFWRVPENVGGCSSNCAINDVGIHVYMQKNGYHYYSIPTSWEVRLGHLARSSALTELDTQLDSEHVTNILSRISR